MLLCCSLLQASSALKANLCARTPIHAIAASVKMQSCQFLELSITCCRFTPAIASINADLQQLAASRQDMHFVNCGQDFTYKGETGRIHAALMPDGVNLNAAGMEQLASCLDPIIHVSHLFLYAVEKLGSSV